MFWHYRATKLWICRSLFWWYLFFMEINFKWHHAWYAPRLWRTIFHILGHYIDNDLLGIQPLSLCGDLLLDCCYWCCPQLGGNPCTAAAGGVEARSRLILLYCSEDGERERGLLGFFVVSLRWYSLWLVLFIRGFYLCFFFFFPLSMCLHLYLDLMKVALGVGR